MVQVLSGHPVPTQTELGEALKQIKDAGLIPEEPVWLCGMGDGADGRWDHVQALLPDACQVLDYSHCAA